jgi:hypothetical protein
MRSPEHGDSYAAASVFGSSRWSDGGLADSSARAKCNFAPPIHRLTANFSKVAVNEQVLRAGTGFRDADDNCGFRAYGWAVDRGDESAGTGLGVGRQLAVARALPLGRAFWSETWATTRANRSWLALNCSATFALPGAICS